MLYVKNSIGNAMMIGKTSKNQVNVSIQNIYEIIRMITVITEKMKGYEFFLLVVIN